MQKFGGVRVLPLLPASMRRQEEEKEYVQMEGVSCASRDNKDAGGVEAIKTRDSKKITVFIEGTKEVKWGINEDCHLILELNLFFNSFPTQGVGW